MEIDYGTSACNFNMGYWSSSNNYGKESVVMCDVDDVLSSSFPATTTTQLPHQPPSASSLDNYSVNDVPILNEMFLLDVDPFSLSLDLVVPSGFWNELMKTEEQLNQLLLLGSTNNNSSSDHTADKGNYKMKAAPKKKRPRRGAHAKTTTRGVSMINKTKKLSRETISQYFSMPIIKAASELNVGLTLLKKRCRELGIRRWPHRKINSLQTLIKNVQEFETTDHHNGPSSEALKKENLERLEQENKLLEDIPDMQLAHTTKRLRQAFFKANYKKRKLMNMGSAVVLVDSTSIQSSQASTASPTAISDHENFAVVNLCDDEDFEDEELKYLLDDCFSSCTLY